MSSRGGGKEPLRKPALVVHGSTLLRSKVSAGEVRGCSWIAGDRTVASIGKKLKGEGYEKLGVEQGGGFSRTVAEEARIRDGTRWKGWAAEIARERSNSGRKSLGEEEGIVRFRPRTAQKSVPLRGGRG